MKKIFAILVSLLFLGSFFGIASIMAGDSNCHCDGTDIVIPSQVNVGQEFIIKMTTDCVVITTVAGDETAFFDYIVQVSEPWSEGDMSAAKFKALKSGTLVFCPRDECQNNCKTLVITPKGYPMLKFMKILGLGQTD
jgi:hypothetical protein